ncbi:MAG: exodeoxyribonuclease VII large subunit [Gammaproteobacteria bacterium]
MPQFPAQNPNREIYSISRLNREARTLLEGTFSKLWVEGEISNLACPASGHLYFTLKDASAQVSCALFKGRAQQLRFKPVEGMQVVARAKVSLYEPRGNYQLIVEQMEEAGDGALQRDFEALKQRLNQEGLFNPEHKQPIPALPAMIGVITSPGGAAIRDVLSVLKRRFPATSVIIYPSLVQGQEAAARLVAAIQSADDRAECDVLLLTRGGGSLEDLWPFNEELVARAVYDCSLPIVSAIGHEIDFVITDFVADQRAATPSAAAELLSPDSQELQTAVQTLYRRLIGLIADSHKQIRQNLQWLTKQLQQQHPGHKLQQQNQRLDELEKYLQSRLNFRLQKLASQVRELYARLLQHNPKHKLSRLIQSQSILGQRLKQSMAFYLERKQQNLNTLVRTLDTVSPLATLQRGYSITMDQATGKVILDASKLTIDQTIETRLSQARVISKITGIKDA